MSSRVLITGLGPVTAFGMGIEPLWRAMLDGRSAIGPVSAFDARGFECRFAAELPADQFKIRDVVPKSYRKATKVMCRDIELAVAGAASAVADAGLRTKATDPDQPPTIPPHRMGCHIGAGLIAADINELTAALATSRRRLATVGAGEGGAPADESDFEVDLADWGRSGMNNLTPLWLLKYLPNMLACHVTIIHDCQGPSNTITCCESSSGLSLGESVRVIARGAADACLTGGVEYKINPMAMYRQQLAGRLARTSDDDDPAAIVRPFDPAARGTVLGEGGGIIIVESARSAEARGVSAYAEVAGFGSTQSHCRATLDFAVDADDPALADAIEMALRQAKIAPDEVDAIAPLGSSIAAVDEFEAAAIRRVFGARAASIPLITTVPNTGNCNAGAGAVALCVAAMALREQHLPARLNTQSGEGLDADATSSRPARLEHILAFTTSQGGQNAAVVLRKF